MKKILLVNALLFWFCVLGKAQNVNNQSVKVDTTPSVKPAIGNPEKAKISKKQTSTDSFPIPKMAAMWSIIPGGGQVYNKKWAFIKVPIVYGALGTTIGLTSFYKKLYIKYKTADYNLRNPIDPKIPPQSGYADIPNNANTTRLREARDYYFKKTQTMVIFTGVAYLLSAAEAFTSAHLAHFDVSDDLSMRIKPSFEPVAASGSAFGLGVQLKF